MLSEAQKRNYEFFSAHLQEYLSDQYKKGKYGVFFEEELKNIYDSFETAFSAACDRFPMGEFIVQQLIDPNEVVEFLRAAVI